MPHTDTIRRVGPPALALLAALATASAQDSVSNIPAPQAPGASDALNPFSPGDQCREYVLDLTSISTSWNTEFCVGPLLKAGLLDLPGVENGAIEAQSISRKVLPAFPVAAYAEWTTAGAGVNAVFNDPPGLAPPPAMASGLGVAFADVGTDQNTVTTAMVFFDQTAPSRLYVERKSAAVNSNNLGVTRCGRFGVGAVDGFGEVAIRFDGFGGDPGCAPVDNSGLRIDFARSCALANGVYATAGPGTTTADDLGATSFGPFEASATLAAPNLIPFSLGGPALIGMTEFGGSSSYVYADGSGSVATTDARGGVSFSAEPVLAPGVPGAAGSVAFIADIGGGVFRGIEIADVDASGTPLGPFVAFPIPALLSDACDGTAFSGIAEVGHFRSPAAFTGGTAQVALGVDQLGRGLAAATVFRTAAGDDPANAIAALIDPSGAAAWTLVAWNGPAASHFTAAGRGKPILDGPGGATVGYLSSTNELTGGAQAGPSISPPAIDSVGNVWFTCPVEYVNAPGDPFNAANIRTTLVRAVLDTSGVADCWELEAVLAEGQEIAGQNSDRDYRIERIPLAGAASTSSGAFFSQNVAQDAFAGIDPSSLPTSDPRTLGGLVLNATILYDANDDGAFDPAPSTTDEQYDVVLYLANTTPAGAGGPPPTPDGEAPPRIISETEPGAPGEGACAEGCSRAHEVLDPVHLFNGEYFLNAVDLRVPGVGMDFVWARRYESRNDRVSPMGHGWDHAYNIFLQPDPGGFRLNNGWGRQTLYEPSGPNTFYAAEYFRELRQNPGNTFTLVFPNTGRWEFHGFTGQTFDGKIEQIVDRNGNTIQFLYDPGTGDLVQIFDTLNRPYQVNYNPDGFVASVTDYTGRQVVYDYYAIGDPDGDFGDLRSVTSPPVLGTPTNNDFPAGKTEAYTYSTGSPVPELNHNLLTVTDPAGQTRIVNEYAPTQNPSDIEFDRIVRQTWGDPGDVFDVVYVPVVPDPSNFGSVIKAIVNDREGHVSEWFFDDLERNVIERRFTGFANPDAPTDDIVNRPVGPLRPTDPPFFETIRLYNDDSLKTTIINPDLSEEIRIYDVVNVDRRAQGNMVERTRVAGPLGGDQPVITETFEYDAGFGGCCGTNFVTRRVDGRGNETVHEYDAAGNRTRTIERVPGVVEDWEYDAFGRVTARVHPDNGSGHRRRDEFTYYPFPDPQQGYLRDAVIDATGTPQVTTYEYDPVGNPIRIIDPKGKDTIYDYNALNQVVRELSRETTLGSGVRYEKLTYYDANDNVVRVDVENRDETGAVLPNSHFTTIHEYEILDERVRVAQERGDANLPPFVLDIGSIPAPDLGEFVITEYAYDDNRNQILHRFGEATNGAQPANEIAYVFDERDLIFQTVRAPGAAEQSTEQYDYDERGNLVARTTGFETGLPHLTEWTYDGYRRMTSETDDLGNVTTHTYDANGNTVHELRFGEITDVPGGVGNVRLSERVTAYDEMDRRVTVDTKHFDTATQTDVGDGSSLATIDYSANSQVLVLTNDNGNPVTFTYDTTNRVESVTDPGGNVTEYAYDLNSNRVGVTKTEVPTLAGPPQVFVHTYAYDCLDRLIGATNTIGETETHEYDSRHNRVLETDRKGQETRHEYDGMSRPVRVVTDMDADGADASDPDDIVVETVYDDSSRVVARVDGQGNATTYDYDAINRRTAVSNADGTSTAYAFDAHHNPVQTTDPNSTVVDLTYDGLDRLVGVNVAPGPGVSGDTTFQTFEYDGLSRVVRAIDDDSVVTRAYDSMSNTTEETLGGDATTAAYDGVMNLLTMTYPGGRTVDRAYDSLERVTTVTDTGGVGLVATHDWVGPDRLLRVDLGNGVRTAFEYDGLLGVPNAPGDFGVRRVSRVRAERIVGGAVVDDRVYAWDRNQNKLSADDVRAGGPEALHAYGYDAHDRLTATNVTDGGGGPIDARAYDLDDASNRRSVAGGADPGAYCLDDFAPDHIDEPVNQYTKTPPDARRYDDNGATTRVVTGCPGDLDFDGAVLLSDFGVFASNFGLASGAAYVQGDLDCDGAVLLGDFGVFASNFGLVCPVRDYEYDFANRLIRVVDDGIEVAKYSYDALGRRTRSDVGGAVTEYRYDTGWQVIEERDGASATTATYVLGPFIDRPISMQRGGSEFYYHADDQGSVRALTDASGAVVERYEYADYGRPLDPVTFAPAAGPVSPAGNPYLFTGRRFDAESGLYHYRTRQLDPVAGRFLTRDTIGVWGDPSAIGNGYAYAASNPATYFDPFGDDLWVGAGAGGSAQFVYGLTWWSGIVVNTSTGQRCKITIECERFGFGAGFGISNSAVGFSGPSDGRKLAGSGKLGVAAEASISAGLIAVGIGGNDSGGNVSSGVGLSLPVNFSLEMCTTTVNWCDPKPKPKPTPPPVTTTPPDPPQPAVPRTPGWMGPGPEPGSPFEGRRGPGWMHLPGDDPVITGNPSNGADAGVPADARPPVVTPGPGAGDDGVGGSRSGESTSCLGGPSGQDQKVRTIGAN